MAKIRWTGQALTELFSLSADEVTLKYGLTREGVYTKRKRIKRQARKIADLMEQDPNYVPEEHDLERMEIVALEDDRLRELLQDFKDAGIPVDEADAGKVERITYWTQHSVDRETGEPVQVVNRYVRMKPERGDDEPEELWPQATPAIIRPTKRKARKEEAKRILVFSDPQIGFRRIIDGRTGQERMVALHDEHAVDLMLQIAAYMQPDQIWNAGDTIDLPELSRFAPDSDHFFKTMGVSFQAVHEMYAQLRADNPSTPIIEVDSNHNDRFKQAILKNFPQAYDMYRPADDSPYPMLSYPYMANLEALEIEFYGGGQTAQYEYGTDYYEEINGRQYPVPPIQLRHGRETSSNGTTASKVVKNHPDVISVQGHNHNEELYLRANRLGQLVGAIIVPPLCKTTGEVPSYYSDVDQKNEVVPNQHSWTNGVLEIVDHNGHYEFNVINFYRGVAYYQGRRFESRIHEGEIENPAD